VISREVSITRQNPNKPEDAFKMWGDFFSMDIEVFFKN
jgi:hypothetical protein